MSTFNIFFWGLSASPRPPIVEGLAPPHPTRPSTSVMPPPSRTPGAWECLSAVWFGCRLACNKINGLDGRHDVPAPLRSKPVAACSKMFCLWQKKWRKTWQRPMYAQTDGKLATLERPHWGGDIVTRSAGIMLWARTRSYLLVWANTSEVNTS